MKCPNCGNEKINKLFYAGLTFETAKLVGCDACIGKKKTQKPPKGRESKKGDKK